MSTLWLLVSRLFGIPMSPLFSLEVGYYQYVKQGSTKDYKEPLEDDYEPSLKILQPNLLCLLGNY